MSQPEHVGAAPVPKDIHLTPDQMSKTLAVIVAKLCALTGCPVVVTMTEVNAAEVTFDTKQIADRIVLSVVRRPGVYRPPQPALRLQN